MLILALSWCDVVWWWQWCCQSLSRYQQQQQVVMVTCQWCRRLWLHPLAPVSCISVHCHLSLRRACTVSWHLHRPLHFTLSIVIIITVTMTTYQLMLWCLFLVMARLMMLQPTMSVSGITLHSCCSTYAYMVVCNLRVYISLLCVVFLAFILEYIAWHSPTPLDIILMHWTCTYCRAQWTVYGSVFGAVTLLFVYEISW